MVNLKLTEMQKLGVRAKRKKQNQVLNSHQNQGQNNKKKIQNRLLAYIRIIIIIICFTYFNAVKSPYCLTATSGITAVAQ